MSTMPGPSTLPGPSSGNLLSRFNNMITTQNGALRDIQTRLNQWYLSHSPVQRVLLAIGGLAVSVLGVLVLIFHKFVISSLVEISNYLENLRYGHLILFVLVFFVGFPPLIGYSALSMLCGMVFGFPGGWPLLASATILGSLASFLVFRFLFQHRAEQLVQHNEKFRAFAEILKEDASLLILVLIRLCPLPYSLSNGALAAIPNLSVLTYVLASVITSPKMFVHIFVGSTIKHLGDEERPFSAKVIDVISILITGCALSLASYIIYKKMQRKLESYHNGRDSNYDELVFGNFNDDLELDPNVELEAGDFDEDNFIIGDDDEDLFPPKQPNKTASPVTSNDQRENTTENPGYNRNY